MTRVIGTWKSTGSNGLSESTGAKWSYGARLIEKGSSAAAGTKEKEISGAAVCQMEAKSLGTGLEQPVLLVT